jgi:hypothetical protein
MREGELIGLQWADVNFAAARFTWSSSSRRDRHCGRSCWSASRWTRLGATSPGSARSSSCSASNGDDHGLVFLDTVSKPCTPPTSCNGASIRCWHGPGSRGFASTTYATVPATLLLGLGVHPKIVIEMLGHSQIAITLDLYSHVTATMQQEAVRAFEGLLGSQVGSQEGATEQ